MPDNYAPRKITYPLLLAKLRDLEKKEDNPALKKIRRRIIKAECRYLRNTMEKDGQLEVAKLSMIGDPWKLRIPHMDDFMYTHSESFENKFLRDFNAILPGSNLNRLQEWVDHYMSKVPSYAHVTNIALMEALVNVFKQNITEFLEIVLRDAQQVAGKWVLSSRSL